VILVRFNPNINTSAIELFLFDKDGYDGVIGDRIVINDITFKIQRDE